MNSIVRKLRGAVLIGVTWFVGWYVFGFVVFNIIKFFDPASIGMFEEPWRMGFVIGTAGFMCGTIFSAIFAFAERSKTIRNLSVLRAALWGLIGGVALPLLTTMNDRVIYNTGPLAAVSAALMIAIVRRAAQKEAPDAQPEVV